jgi:hypothetical protein
MANVEMLYRQLTTAYPCEQTYYQLALFLDGVLDNAAHNSVDADDTVCA